MSKRKSEDLSDVSVVGVDIGKNVFHLVGFDAEGTLVLRRKIKRLALAELQAAGSKVYSELKNLCVWAKTNGGMGTFYRSRHELIYVWKVGTAPHTNTFGLGEKGRYRTNVWDYPGVNSFGGSQKDLALHPTVKPVALVADAIRDVTRRGEIVLDGFGGSGTTLIAAERCGRATRLVELDPVYCDVICRRYAALTGVDPVLAETGETFAATAERRADEVATPETEAAE